MKKLRTLFLPAAGLAALLAFIHIMAAPSGQNIDADSGMEAPAPAANTPAAGAGAEELYDFRVVSYNTGRELYIETPLPFYPDPEYVMIGNTLAPFPKPADLSNIPMDRYIFGLTPEYMEKMQYPPLDDEFLALDGRRVTRMLPEGYYYYLDDGCGDMQILMKLIPIEGADGGIFGERDPVVISAPSGGPRQMESFAFQSIEVPEQLYAEIINSLDWKNEFSYGIKAELWNSPGYSDTYLSATLQEDSASCCSGALFMIPSSEPKETPSFSRAVPVVPYPGGDLKLRNIVNIGGSTFAVCERYGWESWNMEVYHLLPPEAKDEGGSVRWRMIMASDLRGGC